MYPNLLFRMAFKLAIIFILVIQFPTSGISQRLNINEFALYSSDSISIGTGCLFHKSSSPDKFSGSIGSNISIKTNVNTSINGNVYSGGIVQLDNNNIIGGNIAAANLQGSQPALSIGTKAAIAGNIDVNGNTIIRIRDIDKVNSIK